MIMKVNYGTFDPSEAWTEDDGIYPEPPDWCPLLKEEGEKGQTATPATDLEERVRHLEQAVQNMKDEKRDIIRNYEEAFRLLEQRNKELLEALQGMLGVFNTPIARRAFSNEFSEEAIRDAEEAIHKTKTGNRIVVTADSDTGEVRSKLVFTLDPWEEDERSDYLRNEADNDE